jgi:hypothetical protein
VEKYFWPKKTVAELKPTLAKYLEKNPKTDVLCGVHCKLFLTGSPQQLGAIWL